MVRLKGAVRGVRGVSWADLTLISLLDDCRRLQVDSHRRHRLLSPHHDNPHSNSLHVSIGGFL